MIAIEESIRLCRANYENNICDDPNGRPLLADFCPGWKKYPLIVDSLFIYLLFIYLYIINQ
jgi:hypothetical protein